MQMLMIVFRTSLKDRVYRLLHQCDVKAFTEVNETVGYGQTGPAKGLAFHPGTNSVILVALDQEHVAQVTKLVKAWYEEAANHSGWEKPALRVFSWPSEQIV
jgi:nitrogen regulatory protein PII